MRIRWRDFELPSSVTLDESSATDSYAKFYVEPFERGFGHSIGNGLRRVLLSSIEGTAVTAVQIDGVEHEFKTIDGIVQDVTDVVLAFKRVRVRLESEAPAYLELSKVGPCEITAGDLQCPAGVTVVNPDMPICTITQEGVPLKASLTVRRGRGFVAAEETGESMDQIGLIPLDAPFSPVTRVRYAVEATRVGKFTNYDRLVLEIWTDGTVAPAMALTEAAKIYRKHLNPFVHFTDNQMGVPVVDEVKAIDAAAERERERVQNQLSEPIERLNLSTRARNCLDVAGIATLGDLVFRNRDELLAIRNLGQTVLSEVEKKLTEIGLSVGMNREEILGHQEG
ncbi:MAG: DNA-directed RNA polymerase subunit alpha [Planctomycetota bacterium]|nr:MAG: DNA-directed RNA polymerase subunit alpha [Planctomycetota bacterium]